MHLFRLTLLAAALGVTAPAGVLAQAPATTTGTAAPIPADEMEKLVGPIALYPDDLVAVILPASTNPLQIVQADRFLEQRKTNKNLQLDDKWDDAVKTLCNYPDVVKKMSNDLNWTSALGEAVVADTGAVMEGVQAFRRRAQSAGNLKSDSKQTVVIEQEVVKITSANPEVIYVPQYEPTQVVVAGYSAWGYWPTAYPSYYYPYAPGAAFASGLLWGAAIGAAWSGGRYVNHYGGGGNNNINIDRSNNINTGGNIGSGNRGSGNRGGNSATQWKSNKSPGQVSSSVGSNRQSGGRAGDSSFGSGNRGGGAGDRGGAGAGNRGGGGGSAFGGYDSGRTTQMDSNRGASSRSSSGMSDRSGASSRGSSGSSRSMSSGGGSRGGSMGGGSRGGGGRGGGGRR